MQKIDVAETRIPVDSVPINIIQAGKPKILQIGKPDISPAKSNNFPAGKPIINNAGLPQIIIPGDNGVPLPEKTPVEMRKIPCLKRAPQEAKDPGTILGINTAMKYLDIEQGLASGYIIAMYQDKKGNIWLGTSGEGILMYDGNRFLQYSTDNGLPNNYVRCIREDNNGNFWFGTDGGLVKYDGVDYYHLTENAPNAAQENRMDIRSMEFDHTGNLWLGTVKYGAFRFDGNSLSNISEAYGVGPFVSSILKDRNGDLWFGSTRLGLTKYDGKVFQRYTITEGLPGNSIHCMIEDNAGNIWIGTNNGVSIFNRVSFTNYTSKEGLSHNNVNSLLQDKNNHIWIGTENEGVCKYDGKSFFQFNTREGFRSNVIRCMMQDKAGNLLFGTYGGGVMILNENNFISFGRETILNESLLLSIQEDDEHNIWFGGFDGTLIKYDGNNYFSYSAKQGFHSNHIHSMLKDRRGNIWIGSESHGLYKYDGKTFLLYTKNEGLPGNQIVELYEDNEGNVWIGTVSNGVSKFDGKSFTNYQIEKMSGGERIWSILKDSKGNMWFGSHIHWLVKYDGEKFLAYSPGQASYAIHEDPKGNIWIGNSGVGLLKFDGKNFFQISTSDEAGIPKIRSMIPDRYGNFWIGTEKGLKYVVNPDGNPGIDQKIINYTLKDGLPGEAFQEQACFMDSKDRIWWGTDKGAMMLDINNRHVDTTPPVVRLADININGKLVDFNHLHGPLTDTFLSSGFSNIQYKQTEKFYNYPLDPGIPFSLNYLTFHFTVSDPDAAKKVLYNFMVENLDDKWSEPTTRTSVDYRNIPYGKYTFKVRAMGAAGKWSNTFEYPFQINPPWWHTWWFRTLAAASIIFLLYGFFLYRTSALRERKKYLQRTVEKRTEELRVLLMEKEGLLKEIHHRVKNNLEVISSLLQLQTKNVTDEKAKAGLTEGQSRVQSIALIHHKLYRTDEMGSVELCEFAKDLFRQVKDVFNIPGTHIALQINESETWLHTDAAVPFGLILNELFTNAFKYAVDAKKENIFSIFLEKTIVDDKSNYTLIFKDNGPGLPEDFKVEQSNSLGMKVIRLLTRQLGGKSTFYNDNGTIFELHFSNNANNPDSPH